jgi:Zn-dependent alcohol dehydrogenase
MRNAYPTGDREKIIQYKSVIVTKRSGPEVLKIIENDLRAPLAGEARIKILATPVCQECF